jgi:hypothetical protein
LVNFLSAIRTKVDQKEACKTFNRHSRRKRNSFTNFSAQRYFFAFLPITVSADGLVIQTWLETQAATPNILNLNDWILRFARLDFRLRGNDEPRKHEPLKLI